MGAGLEPFNLAVALVAIGYGGSSGILATVLSAAAVSLVPIVGATWWEILLFGASGLIISAAAETSYLSSLPLLGAGVRGSRPRLVHAWGVKGLRRLHTVARTGRSAVVAPGLIQDEEAGIDRAAVEDSYDALRHGHPDRKGLSNNAKDSKPVAARVSTVSTAGPSGNQSSVHAIRTEALNHSAQVDCQLELLLNAPPSVLTAYINRDGCSGLNDEAYQRCFASTREALSDRHGSGAIIDSDFEMVSASIEGWLVSQARSFEALPERQDQIGYVHTESVNRRNECKLVAGVDSIVFDIAGCRRTESVRRCAEVAGHQSETGPSRAENALGASERRFIAAFRNNPDAHIISRLDDSLILEVNPAWESLFGLPPDQAIGRKLSELIVQVAPLDHERVLTHLSEHGSIRGIELSVLQSSGAIRHASLSCDRIEIGEREYMLTIVRDLTRQKLIEEALNQREARLTAILDAEADAIMTIDQRSIIETVNSAADRMFGYEPGELIGESLSRLLANPFDKLSEGHSADATDCSLGRQRWARREGVARRKNGTSFPIESAVSEMGHGRRYTVVIRDASLRKDLEREVVEVAYREQRRIGQDLHDMIGQELTALSILAGELSDTMETVPRDANELAGRLTRGLQRCQNQLRVVIRGLLPVPAEQDGLMLALADLSERVCRDNQLVCTFECHSPVAIVDNLVATHLYLIAQEAVHNAVKHARPRTIRIVLEARDGVVLRVEDDGRGLVPLEKDLRGLGLRIMKNRAAILAARLTISPGVHGGTVVTCRLARNHDD
ncbi:PAS domain-containing sensor histidine kinase [Paludisphaera rhizosphaerae]|uniref:PAS domain-containing sensor histidine kinase n=1 Tax=Paludisphaera rhizosphaerae TaxID=2711216 RepID=UPI0013EAD575|nr:PAS domain S-box protein [Paludisphaera rhizosphaerae]